jgi:phytoene synthase
MPYSEYISDLKFCRDIQKRYAKSFYAGTIFLSSDERDATFVLYAFFRLPDEYVDTYYRDQKDVALAKLSHWNKCWHKSYHGEEFEIDDEERKVLRAAAHVFKKYGIPFEYSQSFLTAMIQDTSKERYDTYEELERYMFGSASVVGLIMTYVLCYTDKKFSNDAAYRQDVLRKAGALGEAFQMTNFLRDIGEDYYDRKRIYVPREDLVKFGVSEDDIASGTVTQNYVDMMKFEIERTNELYKIADEGIKLLPRRAGRGVYVARVLYSKILDKIVEAGYDSLSTRRKLSTLEKNMLALRALLTFK